MNLPSWLLYFISWLTTSYAVYRIFEKTEEVIRGKSKRKISNWLKNIEIKEYNWSYTFRNSFELLFTKKHFSWSCFVRSLISSFIFFLVIYVLLVNNEVGNSVFINVLKFQDIDKSILLLCFIVMLNVIPDYLSLYESRLMINALGKSKKIKYQIKILFLDLFLSFSVYAILGYIGANIIWLMVANKPITIHEWFSTLKSFLTLNFDPVVSTVFPATFYTTFLTSIWLWGYFSSSLLIKFAYTFKPSLNFLKKHLDINRKPIKSIGFVFVILITIFYFIIGLKSLVLDPLI